MAEQPPIVEAPVTVVAPGTTDAVAAATGASPLIPPAPSTVIPEGHTTTPAVLASPMDTKENLAAKTTAEQDKKTKGQRWTNLLWEGTQALIAVSVTAANIYCSVNKIESAAISNAFTLIISIYFVRMNHTKIGGVGGTDTR